MPCPPTRCRKAGQEPGSLERVPSVLRAGRRFGVDWGSTPSRGRLFTPSRPTPHTHAHPHTQSTVESRKKYEELHTTLLTRLIPAGVYRELVDFDDHLEEIRKSWLTNAALHDALVALVTLA